MRRFCGSGLCTVEGPRYMLSYMEMYVCTVKVLMEMSASIMEGRSSKTLVLWKWSVFVQWTATVMC
jgi:hypothetical protein